MAQEHDIYVCEFINIYLDYSLVRRYNEFIAKPFTVLRPLSLTYHRYKSKTISQYNICIGMSSLTIKFLSTSIAQVCNNKAKCTYMWVYE